MSPSSATSTAPDRLLLLPSPLLHRSSSPRSLSIPSSTITPSPTRTRLPGAPIFPPRSPSQLPQRAHFWPIMASSTSSIPSSSGTPPPPPPPPANEDVSSSAHILEPCRKEGTDVLLLFLPGAFTSPLDYFPLAQAVQSRCGFRLWVVVLDPGNAVVVTTMVEASFDGVLQRVKQMGFKPGELASSNVFVGGHSWGAWASRSVALKRAEAFIQLGSCFHTNPDNLAQHPKPVLTLTGALDGQITLAAIAKHAGEIYATKAELGDINMYAIKPVVIVPGMNHAQLSHGIPNKERGDLDAEIPAEQARAIVADVLSSFLTVHVNGLTEEASARALTCLAEAVRQTHALYRSFWEAMDEQGKEAKKLQLELAALPGLTEENVGVVEHDYLNNFVYSKPSIDLNAQRIIVNTYFSPVGTFKLLKNLWIKMKSREAVALAFGSGEEQQEPLSIGALFNEKSFVQALALVPETSRKKFEEHGKKLRFLEDLVIKSGAQDWIDSDLIMKPAHDGTGYVDVQSPVIISPAQGVASRFAGMHYFKLLTVARAMHWILMDCYQ